MAELETIRAVVFQDAGQWIAQCIEVNVAAQGSSVDEAVEHLASVLTYEAQYTEQKHGRAFAGIDAAPARFRDMWENSSKSFGPRESRSLPVDGQAKVDLGYALSTPWKTRSDAPPP